MLFILVIQQKGEGCDYTIGCGIKYRIMSAVDYPEAEKHAKAYIQDMHPPDNDWEAHRAYLAILPSHELLPIQEWYDELRKIDREAEEQETKDRELAELKRLKDKYGNSE